MPELRRAGVAAIGEVARIEGYALAGVAIRPAEDPDAARRAWDALPSASGVVILTPAAAGAIGARRGERLTTVLPA
ncbi:hypothetical protein [Gryllotalpicola sp.]|uniref:hypothetical protein n=1 Tax=Gryllotalpicola sp. TaxID=1932787 RepID=UPI0026162400|nr:hypothetical protein [Gryllotalpicola sp.]